MLVLIFKALNGLGSGYLKDRLLNYQHPCTLCSAMMALVVVPSTEEARLLHTHTRAFSVATSRLWSGTLSH